MNIEQAFQKSLSQPESKGFDSIREAERVLATIWAVEAEVNNGRCCGSLVVMGR